MFLLLKLRRSSIGKAIFVINPGFWVVWVRYSGWEPVCTSNTNPADAETVCNNLLYEVTDYMFDFYDQDKIGTVIGKNGEYDYVYITIGYQGDSLPTDDVNISNLGVTLVHTQE